MDFRKLYFSDFKKKTISAFIWNIIERVGQQIFRLFVIIIMARLLTPNDYGLIGMLAIFIAVSNTLLDSGFGAALIQKKNAGSKDYSTIFYFNIIISLLIYLILYFSSPLIADFYNEQKLVALTKFLSLSIILNSFSLIHQTILIKKIDFKTQTKINLLAIVLSGIFGVSFASLGYGVWSIAIQNVLLSFFRVIFFWFYGKWKPTIEFSYASLRKLFSFGSKLLVSGLLNQIYQNIYTLIIGKAFSANALGYYVQAKKIQEVPTLTLTQILQKVTFPVFSEIQNDDTRLKSGFKKIIKLIAFITVPTMIGLFVNAEPLIKILLTEKWLHSVIFVKLLSIIGIFYPMSAVALNILTAKGRSDLFLKLEIVKKIGITLMIIFTIRFGLFYLIVGQMVIGILGYILNFVYSGRLINYTYREHLFDFMPYIAIGILSGLVASFIGQFFIESDLILLISQITTCVGLYILLATLLKMQAVTEATNIIKNTMVNRMVK